MRSRFASVCLVAMAIPAIPVAAQAQTQPVQVQAVQVQPVQPAQPQAVAGSSIADLARKLLALTGTPAPTPPGNIANKVPTAVAKSAPAASVSTSNATVATSPQSASQSQGGGWSATIVDTDSLTPHFASQSGAPVQVVSDGGQAVETGDKPTLVHLLAAVVGQSAQVDATALEAVWLRTDERRMRVILTAMAQVGTPYRYAGNKPGGFDCSGLTSYSWSQVGVKIPRSSTDQINALAPRTFQNLLPGDIVWRPGHVGMYLGYGDAMVHSPQSGRTVEVRKIGNVSRFGSPLIDG